MRITGMASGFDTESMVQQLMNVERMKVNRYEQQKQINLWKQQAYTNMNKTFANFILNTKKDLGLNKIGSNGIITGNSFDKLDYIRKATSNNDKIASATVTGKAVNGSFVVAVDEAGKDATFVSGELEKKSELTEDLEIAGISVGTKGETFEDVFKKLSKNKELKDMGVSAFYDESTKKMFVQGSGIEGRIVVKGLQGQKVDSYKLDLSHMENNDTILTDGIVIGGKLVDGTKGKSLEEALEQLKKPENLEKIGIKNVEIKKDLNGKIEEVKFETNPSDKCLNIEGLGENITHETDVISSYSEGTYVDGKKAKVTINNQEIEVKNNKINFNGLSIDIKSEGVTTINVSTNTDGIIEKIDNFVKEYNKLVEEMSGKVGEKKHSGFKPLSKEEKESMTDKDIELWEEKAQSGMLNRDETLNKIAAGMRAGLYETVEGMPDGFKNLTQIGITTEKYNKGSVAGKLEIDTEKLRKALEEDPDAVMELLFKDTPAAKGQKDKDPSQQGVFTRVYDTMVDGMKEIVDKSGPGDDSDLLRNVKSNMLIDFVTKRGSISDLDKSILDMNKKIDSMNQLLARKEDSYYAQFTAMEKYVYKMNSQSAWIGQQMM